MSRYRMMLATAADDEDLRARMAADHMSGSIAVSFRREPSYFAGCGLQGESTQVAKCVDTVAGRIVGMGTRSVLRCHVDGRPLRVGYLSDLRAAPEVRRGLLLARAFRYLRGLHEADPVPFYTTVIYEGNRAATDALEGARAGLPRYEDWGRLLTPALAVGSSRRRPSPAGIRIERGSAARLPEIVAFVDQVRSSRQFAPVITVDDFVRGRFSAVKPEDFIVATRGGSIVGALAVWDQRRVRQTHVEGYSGALRWLRPAYNRLPAMFGVRPLPAPGEPLPYVYLAFVAVEGDDASVLRALLHAALDALRGGPWHYAIVGLHEDDPLACVLEEFRAVRAAGRVYVVHWPDQPLTIAPRARRVPCMEAACL